MTIRHLNLFLADDDIDDCMFFREALEELPVSFNLLTFNDGVELMNHLTSGPDFPDALFLDLNMPRKNGLECLREIKSSIFLRELPVLIYSTSYDHNIVHMCYENGAQNYIRKPGDFSKLRQVLNEAIKLIPHHYGGPIPRDKFLIQA